MKLAAISVIPPNVPSARGSNVSFKGENDFDNNVEESYQDEFIADGTDTTSINNDEMADWEDNKQEFQKLADSDNKFIKKLGNLGLFLASGVITYGTTKVGIQAASKVVGKAFKKPSEKLGKLFTETIAPKAKKVSESIHNSNLGQKVDAQFDKFAAKPIVSKVFKFVDDTATKVKNFVVAKETREKAGTLALETLSIGAGASGAIGVEKIAHDKD